MKKILFIAPSGALTHEANLDRAAAYFSARGWQVEASDNIWQKHERFAGNDELRLQELHAAARSDAQVVMAVRGGYGLSRLLSRINWNLIRASKKIWVGHSDFTAFHLALLAQTKATSLAGPMACYDFGADALSPFTERHFWRLLEDGEVNVKVKASGQPKLAVEGRLWGGNLTVLSSLVGTPYLPQVRGGLLFLEDIHEHPYRVERMLYQLALSGCLKQQRAVLLGDFSGYALSAHDNGYDFDRMVAHLRERFKVPILTGLPFGHCADKLTLPVGAKASVVSERGGYRLTFSRH